MLKYVIIQCAEALHKELEGIFSEIHINAYSEIPVDGFMKNEDGNTDLSNWFGSSHDPYRYIMSCSFMEDDKADLLLERIKKFNATAEGEKPISAYIMPVEKYV